MSNKQLIIKFFQELYEIHNTLENYYEAKSYKTIINILNKYSLDNKFLINYFDVVMYYKFYLHLHHH